MAPLLCSRPSIFSVVKSLVSACPVIGARSLSGFSINWSKRCPPELGVHLIMDDYSVHKSPPVQRWPKPKKRRRFIFISHRLVVPGSIKSNVGSPRLVTNAFAAVPSTAWPLWKKRSMNSWPLGMKTVNHSLGAPLPTSSWPSERCKELTITGH